MTPHDLLEAAYRRHGPRVLAYIHARVGNRHESEELFQEVFLVVARNLEGLEQAKSEAAWLIGIARNLVLEHSRRRKPLATAIVDTIVAQETPNSDELEEMRHAIYQLSAVQREALELRLRDELTYEEIAEILQVPIGTVRSRIHHAVKDLKGMMSGSTANAQRSRS